MRIFLSLIALSLVHFVAAQQPVSVLIDCGNNQSPFPWNNLTNARQGKIDDLIDHRGFSTGLSIEVNDAFNGINNSGTTTPDTSLVWISNASADSFFGNLDSFSNRIETTGGVLISGLDTDISYTISIFSSRVATDNRETQYITTGMRSDTSFLNVSSNTNREVVIADILPDSDGNITIQATAGPNNNNSNGFFYLGAVNITYPDDGRSFSQSLELIYPNGGEYWQPGKQPQIRWKQKNLGNVRLEYSIDQGNEWIFIDSVSGRQSYDWTIPNEDTDQCLVRIQSDTLIDQSEQPFAIDPTDIPDCKIVVLGSSTAAGSGPSIKDSAWVWRYRDYIFQHDTRFEVTNLAKGGYTTYNLLPDGTSIPATVNQVIDTARNISKAISLEPNAIIINLPSNDAARSYPVTDQLANYDEIFNLAAEKDIPVWLTTPQPRQFQDSVRINIQLELLDSTFSRYGVFAIDFWNGFATSDHQPNSIFDSGDGVHLNDTAHFIFLNRVLDAGVTNYLLEQKDSLVSSVNLKQHDALINVFPNPFKETINIVKGNQTITKLSIYDSNGKQVLQKKTDPLNSTKHIRLSVSTLSRGVYYLKIIFRRQNKRLSQTIKLQKR